MEMLLLRSIAGGEEPKGKLKGSKHFRNQEQRTQNQKVKFWVALEDSIEIRIR
jgi:hypothetical protein